MKKRIRIALVLNRFYPEVGGAETNLFFQARELAKSCDVDVFTPRRIESPKTESLEGFRVKRLWDLYNPLGKMPNKKAGTFCPSLLFHLLRKRYDIVHCFPAINKNAKLALFASKLSGGKAVLTSFDYLDYASIIKTEGKIDPKIILSHKPSFREKFFIKSFNHIFTISARELHFFRNFNSSASYSPVPVLVDEYEKEFEDPRKQYGIPDKTFIFLCLGRISKIKGQDLALRAFLNIAHAMPDAHLVFVGRGDYESELVGKMKSEIEKHKLRKRVHFTGMVERNEVLAWLKHSDIHVIPVRFMNSGAVVVESWMSGTPVIQSDAVDPDLVDEGKNGFSFPSENVGNLQEKMLRAYRMESELPSMGAEGKKMVIESYTYSELIKLYLKTYSDLLTGN